VADLGHLRARDPGVGAARVAVGGNAVRHVDAMVGPDRHASCGAEVDVVGMGGHHQYAFDLVVIERHDARSYRRRMR
jgi:hypothetical protein